MKKITAVALVLGVLVLAGFSMDDQSPKKAPQPVSVAKYYGQLYSIYAINEFAKRIGSAEKSSALPILFLVDNSSLKHMIKAKITKGIRITI